MSRLSRLRSFWRSLRRGTVRDGSYRPHAAVNLLPQEYRAAGTPQERGSWVLSASTGTKEHGTRTPETASTEACSSLSRLGWTYTVADYLRMPPQGSSYFGRGFSGGRTAGDNPGRARLGSVV